MSPALPLRVLVLEDKQHWRTAGIELVKTAGDRPIAVLPDICGSAVDLIDAIADDQPDVVLIDNFVPWEAGRNKQPWAVRTVAAITRRYGRGRPFCILWTTRPDYPDEQMTYAFVRFGGHNVADKDEDDPEAKVAEVIRATVAGGRWRPPTPVARDAEAERFIRFNLDLIAALDDGMSNRQAADWLTRRGRPINEASVGTTVAKLRAALGIPANEPHEREHKRAEIVAEAYRRGWRWVKVEYGYWDPTQPEHDNTASTAP